MAAIILQTASILLDVCVCVLYLYVYMYSCVLHEVEVTASYSFNSTGRSSGGGAATDKTGFSEASIIPD